MLLEQPQPGLDAYLAEGEAPIVFTSGSAMTTGDDFFAASASAYVLLGRRALFVTRFPNQLPHPLSGLVRHVHYAPFSQLLSRSVALVHHGGIGTAAHALEAGVPQLVAPCCYDQFDNAAHLRRLGVSQTVARDRYNPAHMATILRGLLDTVDVRRRCVVIAARFGASTALSSPADALEQYWKERDCS
jgi:rhamnosyltransferase subunit B